MGWEKGCLRVARGRVERWAEAELKSGEREKESEREKKKKEALVGPLGRPRLGHLNGFYIQNLPPNFLKFNSEPN